MAVKVKLSKIRDNRLSIVKLIKAFTGLCLQEAKEAVDNLPFTFEFDGSADANKFLEALSLEGAYAELLDSKHAESTVRMIADNSRIETLEAKIKDLEAGFAALENRIAALESKQPSVTTSPNGSPRESLKIEDTFKWNKGLTECDENGFYKFNTPLLETYIKGEKRDSNNESWRRWRYGEGNDVNTFEEYERKQLDYAVKYISKGWYSDSFLNNNNWRTSVTYHWSGEYVILSDGNLYTTWHWGSELNDVKSIAALVGHEVAKGTRKEKLAADLIAKYGNNGILIVADKILYPSGYVDAIKKIDIDTIVERTKSDISEIEEHFEPSAKLDIPANGSVQEKLAAIVKYFNGLRRKVEPRPDYEQAKEFERIALDVFKQYDVIL